MIADYLNRLFSHRFAPLVAFIIIAAAFSVVSQHSLTKIRHTQQKLGVTQQKLATTQRKLDDTQDIQINAIRSGCVRLNIELADENISHHDDYDFYSQILKANQDSAATSAAILKKFGIVLPPQVKRDQALEITRLKHDVAAKTWTPLLDCNSITSAQYKLPKPIPFIKRAAPKSALTYPPQPPANPGHSGVRLSTTGFLGRR